MPGLPASVVCRWRRLMSTHGGAESGAAMCARCKVKPRAHSQMGCLCDDCEDVIDGMTQAELDEDYRVHEVSAGERP